ncbi:ThuA domain-containing protein [Parapedobacter koreensis]|uniref:Trehalose utilisation n=1 Tax=Parapedobacter koreensis TaxID=332977 RepID=A0A1H7RLL7_9SPHI|nr:ThuA domain-containing protein [Parapedobacter koreensis]SEL61093.1 Trehalose utilisation [Parapedobacter koreensis]
MKMKYTMKLFAGLILGVMVIGTALGQTKPVRILMVGGGGSHDFGRWYGQEDTKTLESTGSYRVMYTERPDSIPAYLKNTDLLILANNQPIDSKGQAAITKFVEKGKGLLLLHAAVWYNWADWPAYNLNYVGGGSKSHEKFQEFKNYVVNPAHPITQGVAATFEFKDEFYRQIPDPAARGIEVLVIGQSKETDAVYPVVFTVKHPKAKIVGITLGHDEHSHQHEAYKALLINAVNWAAN